MDKFYSLLVESTIIMGLLVLMFAVTICWMYANQLPVPDALLALETLLVGFWLRSKASVDVRKTLPKAQEG